MVHSEIKFLLNLYVKWQELPSLPQNPCKIWVPGTKYSLFHFHNILVKYGYQVPSTASFTSTISLLNMGTRYQVQPLSLPQYPCKIWVLGTKYSLFHFHNILVKYGYQVPSTASFTFTKSL